MKYKLGINFDCGFPQTETEILYAAKKAGFEAFFTVWRNRQDSDKCRELARLAKQENMTFQSIHVYWKDVDTLWYPNEKTQSVIDYHIECIRLCRELSVPLMVLHAFVGFGMEYCPTKEGIENYRKIVRTAEKCGVKLGFENTEGEPYLAAIIKGLGASPVVGYCWDTGHEQCYNSARPMPELYANGKLFGTHFNDNLGITGEKITWLDDAHLLPYDGIIDWKKIMQRLHEINFQEDVLMFELKRNNKPERHTHDKYAEWSLQEFMNQAYARAKCVAEDL